MTKNTIAICQLYWDFFFIFMGIYVIIDDGIQMSKCLSKWWFSYSEYHVFMDWVNASIELDHEAMPFWTGSSFLQAMLVGLFRNADEFVLDSWKVIHSWRIQHGCHTLFGESEQT